MPSQSIAFCVREGISPIDESSKDVAEIPHATAHFQDSIEKVYQVSLKLAKSYTPELVKGCRSEVALSWIGSGSNNLATGEFANCRAEL